MDLGGLVVTQNIVVLYVMFLTMVIAGLIMLAKQAFFIKARLFKDYKVLTTL